jgi:formate dehydrogenase major subunit
MSRRTKNINIVDEDVLLVHPKDAKYRELNTGDVARLYSGRGEVSLKVEVTDKVKGRYCICYIPLSRTHG